MTNKKHSPIILFTDFGHQDTYVGQLKAAILQTAPLAVIVDLCHEILPQNVKHGAHKLLHSYGVFPNNSIFVCVIDPGVGSKRKLLCLKTASYFFLGPDNGLLSLVAANEKNYVVRVIENKSLFLKTLPSSTFHGRDILAPVAAKLSLNATLYSRIGPKYKGIVRIDSGIKRKGNSIIGEIVYFDHFGNAVTNIHKNMFEPRLLNRLLIKTSRKVVNCLSLNYTDSKNTLLGLFNSSDYLELARPKGSAKLLNHLQAGERVEVTYVKKK